VYRAVTKPHMDVMQEVTEKLLALANIAALDNAGEQKHA